MSDSCDPMNSSLPDFSVHGILQARILDWLPFPSPGDLPDPRIEPRSFTLQADALPTELLDYKSIISLCLLFSSADFLIKRPSQGRK